MRVNRHESALAGRFIHSGGIGCAAGEFALVMVP